MVCSLPENDGVHPGEVCDGAGVEVLVDQERGGVVVGVEGGEAQAGPLASHHIAEEGRKLIRIVFSCHCNLSFERTDEGQRLLNALVPPPNCMPYEPAALVDVLPAHGLEGVGAADEEAVGVVAVLLDHAQVVLALADFLALKGATNYFLSDFLHISSF